MSFDKDSVIVIGENFNASRKVKATSPRVVEEDGSWGIRYTDLDGSQHILDVTECIPEDPKKRRIFMIPHIGQACRNKDLRYITYAIRAQEQAGAHIIDLCVDEITVDPDERHEWMRWLIGTVQGITDTMVAIDSSDPETIRAGLEAHDGTKSRPVVNSINLEPGRQELVDMAKERNAILFANASGEAGMPQDAEQRVANLEGCMALMEAGGIPMEDRFLDALVFPVGAGPDFGGHYLEAVRELRVRYPEVHIFGGHSNASFGMPRRKLLNQTFIFLSLMAGCDAFMIDPVMNNPKDIDEFKLAADALLGKDEFSINYVTYCRSQAKKG